MISVLIRTLIRLRLQKRLFIDDAFLYFAVMCLCASEVLLWRFSNGIFSETVILMIDDSPVEDTSSVASDEVGGVYMILTYMTIYFVKLSFLFFFRTLVRRYRKMTIYWWTVLAIIIITLFVSIVLVVVPLCVAFPIQHGMDGLSELCVDIKN